jgi:tetratricopeptide (TPR) repeat protein
MLMRLLLICLLFSGTLVANDQFGQGFKAAQGKNYAEAIAYFEILLLEEPGNSSALFNLGNCYYAEKNFGKAILNYEKAHKLEPGDDEIQTALSNVYNALGRSKTWESPYPFLDSAFYRVGSFSWSLLALFFSLISAVLLFLILAKVKQIRIPLRIPVLLISLFLVLFFTYAGNRAVVYAEDNSYALVTDKTIPILKNEFGEMSDRTLNVGDRVKILQQLASYLLVRTSTGEEVLVLSTDIERIQTF